MRVSQLWRFPVKSMGGTQVDRVRIDPRGVHADRLWAVRDVAKDVTASARRLPALLGCSARYLEEPARDAGPGNVPAVVITFPDGQELSSGDPEVHDALTELVGREMRLVSLPPVSDKSQHRMTMRDAFTNLAPNRLREDFGLNDTEALPDASAFSTKDIITLARYSTPPGAFVDLSPLHVLTTASLTDLSADGTAYDVRRFRPNVLVDTPTPEREFPESEWAGGELTLGTAVLQVTAPTIRCVVPTRAQPGVDLDRAITRQLAQRTNRYLGVYADIAAPGVIALGDTVDIRLPRPPGPMRRAGCAISRSMTRQAQRVIEATARRARG